MGGSPKKRMTETLRQRGGCPNRRDFLKTCAALAAGAAVEPAAALTFGKTASAAPALPSWTGESAVSDVFVVNNIPAPTCSLASGVLPGTGACSTAQMAFRDAGVETLINLMRTRGTPFYRTADHPAGVVPADAVVILKINNQWGGCGSGTGYGRLSTNTDLLKGVIWKILQHPDGFSGEVVVADNAQPISSNQWGAIPANAEDQNQTYDAVVQAFVSQGHPVSLADWTALNANLIDAGAIDAAGYAGEYASGDVSDGYVILGEPAGSGAVGPRRLSYPKFQTQAGNRISLRHGLWNGAAYDADRVRLINFPVLKKHCMAGCTAAWKNLVGFISCAEEASRFGGWDEMHGFFWDYVPVTPASYGLLGRQMGAVRNPDLHILDAIWVATQDNFSSDAAVRLNALLASRDPFALDWYASEYLLRPLIADNPWDVSAARGGIFRTATRINQKAAQSAFGSGYSFIDLDAGYDGSTPSEAEKNQMNVHVVSSVTGLPAVNGLLLE